MTNNPAKWSLEDVQQDLLDNADFVAAQSVAKAKAFSTAAARWLIMRPVNASGEGRAVVFNVTQVMEMKRQAEQFIEIAGTGGVKYLGTVNYRGYR